MTSSTLLRLFRLAKATGAQALENYTTEALAAAVRADPGPLLAALTARAIVTADGVEVVQTQVHIAGTGILDLVVRLVPGCTVWIEAKVGAGESGDQLRRYVARIASMPTREAPKLVILGPAPLSEDPTITWLPWQALYDAIPTDSSAHAYWTDFRRFLKDIDMADDSNDPTTTAEQGSLGAAHRMLTKMTKVLAVAGAGANEVWPGSNWPADPDAVRKQLGTRFAKGYGLTIEHKARYWPCGISMGAYHDDGSDEGWLGIWIWCQPKRVVERDRIWATADDLKLPWERDPASWELIGAHKRLAEFADHAEQTEWLVEHLDDLKHAGLITLLPTLGSGEPALAEPGDLE
ncbi:MAG: hypothetical protein KC766_06475 [Myxococcales bacterium]|nr:hypothetical protein [Myxococcales bacterium]